MLLTFRFCRAWEFRAMKTQAQVYVCELQCGKPNKNWVRFFENHTYKTKTFLAGLYLSAIHGVELKFGAKLLNI
jgi:hypothetical protein